jgi:hypothetical protein
MPLVRWNRWAICSGTIGTVMMSRIAWSPPGGDRCSCPLGIGIHGTFAKGVLRKRGSRYFIAIQAQVAFVVLTLTSSFLARTTGHLFARSLYSSTLFRPAPSAIFVREGLNLLALIGHRDKDFDKAHKPRLGENGRALDNLTIKRDDNVYNAYILYT